jgi:hypothetical protein
MPLPKPTLDNRRFDQLVGEGRALIPRLAPLWSDFNASDPGITLLELGAWLAEQNIYRFDRVSDEALRAFVRLVGIEPAMPGVAGTVVTLVNANAMVVALPERMQLAQGQTARFETTEALNASPAQLVSVMAGGSAWVDDTAANQASSGFDAFGPRPRTDHALYLGFDRALDVPAAITPVTLSLYIWTDHWQADAATRAALQAEYAALSTPAPSPSCMPPDWRRHYRVTTVWEYFAGSGGWQALHDVSDETRALTLSGFVRFTAPVGHAAAAGAPFLIRCRIVRGRFECTPRLIHVGWNAVDAEHALSVDEQSIGRARGHAQAVFALDPAPVVAGSVRLRLDDGAGGQQTDWRETPDFERAGPFDRVFMHTPETGVLQSGDGLRAAILPAGYQLFAAWRVGGGPGGNLGANTLDGVPANPHNLARMPALAALAQPLTVSQVCAASGGALRETLAAAQARAYDLVSGVDKAVTLADIERLALATPGVPVARVQAVANLDPLLPCYPALGVITLIVIPPCPTRAPLPSQALLNAVERYLEPRRLVTSEIHAIAPHYLRVSVIATLNLACEADASAVLKTAAAQLDAFFDSLHGGPDGTGWPFGRTVYRTEVMALLADVAGVASVTALGLVSGYGDTGGNAADNTAAGCGCNRNSGCGCGGACACGGSGAASAGRCDNLTLCAHELVMPGRHRLTIESERANLLKRSDAHECESV